MSSLTVQSLTSEELRTSAITVTSLKKANKILVHPNCDAETKQQLLAKLKLFAKKDLQAALRFPSDYHPDIVTTITGHLAAASG